MANNERHTFCKTRLTEDVHAEESKHTLFQQEH